MKLRASLKRKTVHVFRQKVIDSVGARRTCWSETDVYSSALTNNMPPKAKVEYLTIDTLKLIWENDFLPSIKNEFQSQLESVRGEIKTLSKKCIDIEKSQNFMSREFENFKESLQTTKNMLPKPFNR